MSREQLCGIELETPEELTKAVNQYLATEDRIGPLGILPEHPRDRDTRALRAYYRALATNQHYAARIAMNDQKIDTANSFYRRVLITKDLEGDEFENLEAETAEMFENDATATRMR